jgi:hypothetical protein
MWEPSDDGDGTVEDEVGLVKMAAQRKYSGSVVELQLVKACMAARNRTRHLHNTVM